MQLKSVKQGFNVLFGLLSLSVTLYSIAKFVIFISNISAVSNGVIEKESNELKFIVRALFSNSIWLILFILQHSFGKHENVRKFWEKIGFKTLERSAYNIISSYILLQMVEQWIVVNKWTLWEFSIKEYSAVWYAYILLHSAFWLIIFGGSLLMDVPEILGIKHIYYDIKGLNHPSLYKAIQHNHLLTNVRHPSYIGFCLLFWLTNLMSLDRLILASFLTAYMFVAWSPDRKDYQYQQQQLELKKLELRYDFKQK